eukprot:10930984-Alexandrium_andersonii.AAC.1
MCFWRSGRSECSGHWRVGMACSSEMVVALVVVVVVCVSSSCVWTGMGVGVLVGGGCWWWDWVAFAGIVVGGVLWMG